MSNPTHDEKQAVKTPAKTADKASAAPATAAPSPAQVDKMVGAAAPVQTPQFLAVPDVITLGDNYVGRRNDREILFFNLEGSECSISARLEGDPALILASAPSRLRPSREGFDPNTAFKFYVMPTREGYHQGTLHVQATWPHASKSYAIPLKVPVHVAGTPTLAEREAEAQAAEAAKAKEREEAAARARLDKDIAEDKRHDHHYHSGHKEDFEKATKSAERAFAAIYHQQRLGVQTAEREIGNFKRKLPPQEPDFLRDLAIGALDSALGAITGGVSKAIVAKITKSGSVGAELVGMLVGKGLDAGMKAGQTAAVAALKPGAPGTPAPETTPEADGTFSFDPKGSFFGAQTRALNYAEANTAEDAVSRVHDALLPTLRKDPTTAIAKMSAVSEGLKTQFLPAEIAQAQHTVEAWLRVIAQTSVGRAGKGKATHVDGDKAAEAYSQKDPLTGRDGVLDIFFDWGPNPRQPAKPTSARLLGVKKAVAQRIQQTDLKRAKLPIRLATDLRSADYSITIVRDEAGNVSHNENTQGSAPAAPSWLRQRAGESKSPDDGAKALLKEILAQPLPPIQTDSDE